MIINIPINIDEEHFNKLIVEDYERKIEDRIYNDIKKALCGLSYGYRITDPRDGILNIAEKCIDKVILDYKDEIIGQAAEKLAQRLSRTKAAKELL